MVKEEDPDVASVCVARTRCSKRSCRSAACNLEPTDGGDSDETSEGHVTSVTDDEAPLINKNTGDTSSPVLQDIDDDTSLATRSLGSSFSPHVVAGKYSVSWPGKPVL